MTKRSDQFQTIRTEGALLPPDILQWISSLKVDGVSPQAYHLPPSTKLNEAIAHSWGVLQKYWKGFQEARQVLDDFIDRAQQHVIMDRCICRNAFDCDNFTPEIGCLFMGETALKLPPGLGRRVTKDQAQTS